MAKLRRLRIHGYRNVRPCELVFGDRFNVLLGPNGSGKTTLLNLISNLLRSKLDDPSDPVHLELELGFNGGTFSGTVESTDDPMEGTEALPAELRDAFRRAASTSPRLPQFSFKRHRFEPPSTVDVRRDGDTVLVGPDRDREGFSWPLQLLRARERDGLLSQCLFLAGSPNSGGSLGYFAQNTTRFDESLDTFRAITADRDEMAAMAPGTRPRFVGLVFPSEDRQLVWPIHEEDGLVPMRAYRGRLSEDGTRVVLVAEHYRFLTEVVRLLGLRSATAMLEVIRPLGRRLVKRSGEGIPESDIEAEEYQLGNLQFWFVRKDGRQFSHRDLSYGQKRLLAFLYYLDANPDFVIADELVNGLHHAWIEECVNAIGERQAFLTSQNPLLLDYLTFESVEQVRETFILCRTEEEGGREVLVFRNLTSDEASMFYRAYSVGIEHVGEILRTRGLW